jgi:hypothetical protein
MLLWVSTCHLETCGLAELYDEGRLEGDPDQNKNECRTCARRTQHVWTQACSFADETV